jgi:muramoyltetrapeptide carboxypeptidase
LRPICRREGIGMGLKGRALPEGGTIGVPAPAWPYYNRSDVLRGVEWWEARGYKVKLGDGIYDRHGYVAGDPKSRARDLMSAFDDDDVDVVQCFDAGYGSGQTIPFIDFDVIRANPKPFIGYSDITALHQSIRHHTELVTFYGPLLSSVNHSESQKFTNDHMLKALTSTEPLGEVPRNPDDPYLRSFNSGSVTGPLVGGCLWLLGQTIGTPWQVDLSGKIFFFEDVTCPPWYIDGLFNQMMNAGLFTDVIGVVVGELEACDWRNTPHDWPGKYSIEDVLEDYIEPLGVPTIYGLPLGHGKYLSTIPLGVEATLDADAQKLTIIEAALL